MIPPLQILQALQFIKKCIFIQDGDKEKQKKKKVWKYKHFRRIKAFARFDTQTVSLSEFWDRNIEKSQSDPANPQPQLFYAQGLLRTQTQPFAHKHTCFQIFLRLKQFVCQPFSVQKKNMFVIFVKEKSV